LPGKFGQEGFLAETYELGSLAAAFKAIAIMWLCTNICSLLDKAINVNFSILLKSELLFYPNKTFRKTFDNP
jgi:hypothetical protein